MNKLLTALAVSLLAFGTSAPAAEATTATNAATATATKPAAKPATAEPETPVLMIGDSMMRLLGVAMERQFTKAGVAPAHAFSSLGSGLVRPAVFDWNAKVAELLAEHHPKTVFVSLGTNDRQTMEGLDAPAIRYGAPEWESEYARRIAALMDQLHEGGATRVVWLLLPDMKDAATQEHAKLVNRIVTAAAQDETRRDFVTLFDLGPVLSRNPGTISQYVMSATGAALTVRDPDGVHLTNDGAKLCARSILKTSWNK